MDQWNATRGTPALSEDDKARMERNRLAALERRRQRQQQQPNPAFFGPFQAPQPPQQRTYGYGIINQPQASPCKPQPGSNFAQRQPPSSAEPPPMWPAPQSNYQNTNSTNILPIQVPFSVPAHPQVLPTSRSIFFGAPRPSQQHGTGKARWAPYSIPRNENTPSSWNLQPPSWNLQPSAPPDSMQQWQTPPAPSVAGARPAAAPPIMQPPAPAVQPQMQSVPAASVFDTKRPIHRSAKKPSTAPLAAQPKPKFSTETAPMKKFSLNDKNNPKPKPYGPSITLTLAPPDPNRKKKKMSQATLGQTMQRYRAHKADAASVSEDASEEEQLSDVLALPVETLFSAVNAPAPALPSNNARMFSPPTGRTAQQQPSLWKLQPTADATPASLLSFLTPFRQPALSLVPRSHDPSPLGTASKLRARSVLFGPEYSSDAATSSQERWNWLKDCRDSSGLNPLDPGFDPRTLLIAAADFHRLKGFNAQYWAIKKDAMDIVLFVRVGSFYELYDTDADVGLKVGLNPMGSRRDANMWKVGCTASAFPQWAAKVLALGYNVGRVEECRGQAASVAVGGRKLVERKLVQIYTPGTMLFPHMDDAIESCSLQPFVALYEGSNGLLGACVVDVRSATLVLSQWQEVDVARSMLSTLLTQINPAEVVVLGPGQLSIETRKALKRHKPLVADGVERPLAVSMLRRFDLRYDPENPTEVPHLLERAEGMYFSEGGNDKALEAAALSLCEMPHAAAAMMMAMAHLAAARVSQHVLPNATISSLASFTPDGARTTGHMLLDSTAISSLELIEGSLGGVKGSLLSFLSASAVTAAGRRRIREWICSPLYRVGDINERLNTVSAFMQLPEAMGAFQGTLLRTPNCQHLLPKVATVLSSLGSFKDSDSKDIFELQNGGEEGFQSEEKAADAGIVPGGVSPARLRPATKLFEGLGAMMEAVHYLQHAIDNQRPGGAAALPPLARVLTYAADVAEVLGPLQQLFSPALFASGKDELTLQAGISEQYDAASAEVAAAAQALEAIVEQQRKALAGPSASAAASKKVKLTETDGKTVLEVPIALKSRLNASCNIVKETKTLIRVEVPEATAAAARLDAAKEAAERAVMSYLAQSSGMFLSSYPSFVGFCNGVAALDALAAFAEATHPQTAPEGCSFCRPVLTTHATATSAPPLLKLESLWNPQLLLADLQNPGIAGSGRKSSASIQPNDLVLGGSGPGSSTLLLTGANTGGKSTLLRSACIATIMAQIGCFVPCSAAEIAPVDRIFTRMGGQDRIASGESTFLVEVTETAAVLRHAQRSSLVVLDELGRGTSTNDGHAIASAVAWWLTQKTQCRILFATHYHGLMKDADLLHSGAILGHMASSVIANGGLLPSYRLLPGAAPEGSCGIAVAASAGLPMRLVQRAEHMARQLEIKDSKAAGSNYIDGCKLEELRYDALRGLKVVLEGSSGAKAAAVTEHLGGIQKAVYQLAREL